VSWFDGERDDGFIDAERIYKTLEAAANGPNLYEACAAKFPDRPTGEGAERPEPVDEPAFLYLVEHEFVDVPTELRNAIDRFRHLDREAERTRQELQEVYRKLRTMQVRLKKADRDQESGFSNLLKSKTQRWEEKTRRDALARDIDDMTLKRRRLESDLEKAGTLFKDLLDRIFADLVLRDGHWFHDMPVVVTKYGRFLLDYLSEMNPEHFRGRTLAEIIEIGHSLA
jgi:hypothetical protein